MESRKNYKAKPADIVRQLREAANMSQEELAADIECSTQTISNIECGKYLSLDKAIKIAHRFNVPLDYVLGKIEKDEYRNGVVEAVTLMKRTAEAVNTLVEYLCATAGKKKIKLTEAEKELLINEIEWYGNMRLNKIVNERGGNNGKKEQGK